jgi:hypothetical protein
MREFLGFHSSVEVSHNIYRLLLYSNHQLTFIRETELSMMQELIFSVEK